MKKIQIILFILFVGFILGCSSDADSQNQTTAMKSEQKVEVKWLDFNRGLNKAKAENKPVLIDFFTDWCHWCKVLDEKTFKNEDVAKKLHEKFITIRIDAEDNTKSVEYKGQTFTNIELTRTFKITGFPSLGFLDSSGEVITLIPGFVPPEQFINILGYIDQECYKKKISFEDYLAKKGDCK